MKARTYAGMCGLPATPYDCNTERARQAGEWRNDCPNDDPPELPTHVSLGELGVACCGQIILLSKKKDLAVSSDLRRFLDKQISSKTAELIDIFDKLLDIDPYPLNPRRAVLTTVFYTHYYMSVIDTVAISADHGVKRILEDGGK